MTGLLDPSRRRFLQMLLATLGASAGVGMTLGSGVLGVLTLFAVFVVANRAHKAADAARGRMLLPLSALVGVFWLIHLLVLGAVFDPALANISLLPAVVLSALLWWHALDILLPADVEADKSPAQQAPVSALMGTDGLAALRDGGFTPFPTPSPGGSDFFGTANGETAPEEPVSAQPADFGTPKKRSCPTCWKTAVSEGDYCGHCGSPMSAATMTTVPVARAIAAPPVAPRRQMTVADVYSHHNRSIKPSTVVWDPALYRAPLGRRFLASLLDTVIAIALGFLASIVFGVGVALASDSAGVDMELALGLGVLAGFLVWQLVAAGYFFTEALFGATAGKFMCGLRIAQADGQPGNIGFWFARYWFKYLWNTLFIVAALSQSEMIGIMALVALVLTIIGYLAVLGPSSQTFHDRASGTAVFMASDLQSGIADIVLARRLAGQLGGNKSPVLRNVYATMGVIIVLVLIGMRDSAPVWTTGTNQRSYTSPAPAVSAQPPADDFMQQQIAAAQAESVQPVANYNAGQQVPVAGSGSGLSQERIAKAWEHIRVFDAAVREVAQKVEHHKKMAHYLTIQADNHSSMGDMHEDGLNAAAARREYLLAFEKYGVAGEHLDAAKALLRRHFSVLAQSDEFLFRLGMDAESKGLNDLAVECYRRVAGIGRDNAHAAKGRLNALGADW